MKLQDQVIPLPMAQRMKELGVKQESLFWWTQEKTPSNRNEHYYGCRQENMPWDIFLGKISRLSGSQVFEEYAAFTVAELVMAIGMYAFSQKHGRDDFSTGFAIDLDKAYTKLLSEHPNISLGALLIHLLESNLITVQEVNTRI